MLHQFYDLVVGLFQSIHYTAVFVMMTLEATVIPFPSEIPMLAIGLQSALGEMNPFFGLLVALLGVWLGTTINYFLGYFLGNTFIEKYGKYFFIKLKAYHHAQELFLEDANFYTFFGRLIPVVRQLISIPAGMARMPYGRFIGLSLLGSTIWLTILIVLGYIVGNNLDLIHAYLGWFSGGFIVLAIVVWWMKHHKKS